MLTTSALLVLQRHFGVSWEAESLVVVMITMWLISGVGWAGWMRLVGLIAGRFGRVEPRRRVGAYLRGLLAGLERKNGWTLAEHRMSSMVHLRGAVRSSVVAGVLTPSFLLRFHGPTPGRLEG